MASTGVETPGPANYNPNYDMVLDSSYALRYAVLFNEVQAALRGRCGNGELEHVDMWTQQKKRTKSKEKAIRRTNRKLRPATLTRIFHSLSIIS